MKRCLHLCVTALSLIALLSGCTSATNNTAYPGPAQTVGSNPVVVNVEGPNFSLSPIAANATEVSGTAPANLELLIVDVTTSGTVLGQATSDAEGNFKAQLTEPVLSTHQIGIQLTREVDIAPDVFKQLVAKGGPNMRNYPNVGFIFDSRLVEQ